MKDVIFLAQLSGVGVVCEILEKDGLESMGWSRPAGEVALYVAIFFAGELFQLPIAAVEGSEVGILCGRDCLLPITRGNIYAWLFGETLKRLVALKGKGAA